MRPPLGLPKGSVRAILTLSVGFTTIFMILFAPEIPTSLGNVFIVSITFYFSTRASVYLISDELKEQLKETDKGPPPLYLPPFSVRIILSMIVLTAIGLIILNNQEIPIFMITVFVTIIGYVLGILAKNIIIKIFPPKPGENRIKEFITHLQAGVVVLIVVGICILNIISTIDFLPLGEAPLKYTNQILELTIGYYFGSRTLR